MFFLRFGWTVLDPGSIAWLLGREDPAAYYLAWGFFRGAPWSFPLGHITHYLYPLGASVPYVDIIPLLAYPARLLSPLLPATFQYFGFWHCVCAVLQAYFGFRIVMRFVPTPVGRIAGALLFVVAPSYLFREGHIGLSSHWVILAAIALYLDGVQGSRRSTAAKWCALAAIVALVHPYLVAMMLVFYLGMLARTDADNRWRWPDRIATTAAMGAVIAVVWWIAGNFDGTAAEPGKAWGFGWYSLNLNAFANPMGYSTLLPDLQQGPGQYEGYAYLGAGWLMILVLGILTLLRSGQVREQLKPHRGLLWMLLATYLFALSNIVRFNETVILEYKTIPVLDMPAGIFRASGRFVWPGLYAIMTGLVYLVGRIRMRGVGTGLLVFALGLQVWDVRPLVFQREHFRSIRFESRLTDSNWNAAAALSEGITTIPPFKFELINRADFREFCWLALENGIPTTAGYTARMSRAAAAILDSMMAAIASGSADSTQLYVCDRRSFPKVLCDLGEGYRGSIWNGYPVCYRRGLPVQERTSYVVEARADLAEFLGRRRDKVLVLAVCDEATNGLSDSDRGALEEVGFEVSAMTYRGAAAAIIDHGHTVWQRTETSTRIDFTFAAGEAVGPFRAAREIRVVSAGFEAGNEARLCIDGRDEGFCERGLNFLVMDDAQRVVEVAWFDTHAGEAGVILRHVSP